MLSLDFQAGFFWPEVSVFIPWRRGPPNHVMYEVPVVVTGQERHFEPCVRCVLGTDKSPA